MTVDAGQLAAHRHKYRAAIDRASRAGDQHFAAWFNRETYQTSVQGRVRSFWDFQTHILTPTVTALLHTPEHCIALEIGYGGGRLMAAACHFFGWVYGVDIHAAAAHTARLLREAGHRNFGLLQTAGDTLPCASGSLDFVYSFIVLQHLPDYPMLVGYLHEIRRCLRVGGVAQLYFGRYSRMHPLLQLRWWRRGYRALPDGAANRVSLLVRMGKVRAVCRALGLRVVASGTSYYRVPDGYPRQRGGQSYVTLLHAAGSCRRNRKPQG